MPTSREMHDYILECLRRAGNVSTRRMMGNTASTAKESWWGRYTRVPSI